LKTGSRNYNFLSLGCQDRSFPGLQSPGQCYTTLPGLFSSPCSIDVCWFPFDDQRCTLRFGAWDYIGEELDLQAWGDNVIFDDYMLNGEWDVLGTIYLTYLTREKKFRGIFCSCKCFVSLCDHPKSPHCSLV